MRWLCQKAAGGWSKDESSGIGVSTGTLHDIAAVGQDDVVGCAWAAC